jgi:aflatoxin B1 aldehyde reductase
LVGYHSALKPEHGGAVIFGASKLAQVEETIGSLKSGPLKPESVKAIDDVWDRVKHDAPLDDYHSFAKLQNGKAA